MKSKKLYLINTEVKSPLANLIKKEYNNLVSIISIIKHRSEKNIEGPGGIVSVSDIISYQIGWGNLLIGWYETGLEGKSPQMPGEGFSKWDYVGLAKHFYEKYKFDNEQKQDQEFYKIVSKIINFTEKEYDRGNLDKIGVWDWCTLSSGKKWPLSKWIKINTAAPYKKAATLVKKFCKNSKELVLK